ncbi:unnamed protein product, partial [marine sediment metagenome]
QLPNNMIIHSFIQKEGTPKVFEEVSRVWVRSFYIPTTYRGIPFGGHYHFPFNLVTVFSPSYVCDAQGLILKGSGITPLYHESHFKIDYPTRIAGVGGIQRCDTGGAPIDVEAYSIVEGKKLRHFRFERIMNINGLGGIGDEYTFGLWCVDYERSTPFYDYLTGQWNTCIYICLSLPRGMPSGETFKFIVRDKLHPEIIYLEEKHTKLSSENFWVFQEHITFIESTTKPESISLKIEVYRPTTATSP